MSKSNSVISSTDNYEERSEGNHINTEPKYSSDEYENSKDRRNDYRSQQTDTSYSKVESYLQQNLL